MDFLKKFQAALPNFEENFKLAKAYIETIEDLQIPAESNPRRLILRSNGSICTFGQWQVIYGVSGNKVGKFFSTDEEKLSGAWLLAEPLIRILDILRAELKKPVELSSAFRTIEHQISLQKNKALAAASISPHCGGFAADIKCNSAKEVYAVAELLRKISIGQKIEIRIGFEDYLKRKQNFVHVDVCPEYFGKGKPFEFLSANFPSWTQKDTW